MNQRLASSATLAAIITAVLLARVPARAEVMHLPIDTQKSKISPAVAEPLSRLRDVAFAEGKFHIVSGDISGDPSDVATTGHVNLVIDLTTYDSANERRDTTVISSALETKVYSTASFESARIEKVEVVVPGAVGSATVVGNLSLHGTTRQINVPVRLSLSPEGQLTADGEVTFPYTDFGVKVPRLAFVFPAGDQVTVKFRIIAERPQPIGTPSTGSSGSQ